MLRSAKARQMWWAKAIPHIILDRLGRNDYVAHRPRAHDQFPLPLFDQVLYVHRELHLLQPPRRDRQG